MPKKSFKRLIRTVSDQFHLSIQSRLMLMLLFVAINSIVVVSWIAYSASKSALTAVAFNQLTSVRASKRIQIEAFFKTIRYQVSNLATDRMTVDTTRDLIAEFKELETTKIHPEWDRKLEAYYTGEFVPQLAKGTGQVPRLDAFLPKSPATRYIQYFYTAANPFPEQRYKLEDPGDGSAFSRTHRICQPVFVKFVQDFGYDNLILADSKTGNVIYTFGKAAAIATNLLDGPYSDSSAAKLFRTIRDAGSRRVHTVDFAPALYASGKAVALMGAPIFEGADQIGVLMIQFATDEINRVMTDNMGWESGGLGKTGEAYLVGPDMLMRSRSRLLWEDKKRYFDQLERADYSPEEIERVRRNGTATLAQAARTDAVKASLAGKSGTAILNNYLHFATLSSFAPIGVPGLKWVIVAEMQEDEAFAPLIALTHRLVVWSLVTILAVTVIAAFFGRNFVSPIFRLVEGVDRLKSGERDVTIKTGTEDEFEEVGSAFNRVTRRITALLDNLSAVTKSRDDLIDSILPGLAASRMKAGRNPEVDDYPELSILFASFVYRGETGLARGVAKSLALINDLTIALDDAAERHGLQKLSGNGASYSAACGLTRQRLDHASRTIDFALDMLRIVSHLQRDRQVDLWVQIGVGSGAAAGGIAGLKRITYQLAGESMTMAGALAARAPRNTILVSSKTYTSTQTLYRFGPSIQLPHPGSEPLTAWPLQLAKSMAAAESLLDEGQLGADFQESPTNVQEAIHG